MHVPRVYGNESRCRATIGRYIGRGEELLEQAEGVRNRLPVGHRDELPSLPSLDAFLIEYEWSKDVRRWFQNARQGLGRFMQDQMDGVLPVLSRGLPPDSGRATLFVLLLVFVVISGVAAAGTAHAAGADLGVRGRIPRLGRHPRFLLAVPVPVFIGSVTEAPSVAPARRTMRNPGDFHERRFALVASRICDRS